MPDTDKDVKDLMIFFETCLVDQRGNVNGRRMNDADYALIPLLKRKRFIAGFGRLSADYLALESSQRLGFTHWVRFTPKGWALAHEWRRERSERMIAVYTPDDLDFMGIQKNRRLPIPEPETASR